MRKVSLQLEVLLLSKHNAKSPSTSVTIGFNLKDTNLVEVGSGLKKAVNVCIARKAYLAKALLATGGRELTSLYIGVRR